jgi:hypothetical protein
VRRATLNGHNLPIWERVISLLALGKLDPTPIAWSIVAGGGTVAFTEPDARDRILQLEQEQAAH